MMDRKTQEIVCPESKAKAKIKEWLTGAEGEYIEAPILAAIERRRAEGKQEGGVGEQSLHVRNHRIVEMCIASLEAGGKTVTEPVEIVRTVLNELSEGDYAFILNEIDRVKAEAKKKLIPSNTSAPIASAA